MSEIERPERQRPCYEIVLNALKQSPGERTILVDGITFGWNKGKLCHAFKRWKGSMFNDDGTTREPDDEMWMVSEVSFNAFVDMCNKIPQEEIVNICFQSAMIDSRKYTGEI